MSEKSQDFWNDKLTTFYRKATWTKEPNVFAQQAIEYFPEKGALLELGTGIGQDAKLFAEQGYDVTATDFSEKSLVMVKTEAEKEGLGNINFKELNLIYTFPFKEKIFDMVYAHLSLHYFTVKTTRQIFSEISRVLKDDGIVALLVNSVHDSEWNQGIQIEKDYFELGEGNTKRFFSSDSIVDFTKNNFKTILCDEEGKTVKDNVLGNSRLIRYIGSKL